MSNPATPRASGTRIIKIRLPAEVDTKLDAFRTIGPVRAPRAAAALALIVRGLDAADVISQPRQVA